MCRRVPTALSNTHTHNQRGNNREKERKWTNFFLCILTRSIHHLEQRQSQPASGHHWVWSGVTLSGQDRNPTQADDRGEDWSCKFGSCNQTIGDTTQLSTSGHLEWPSVCRQKNFPFYINHSDLTLRSESGGGGLVETTSLLWTHLRPVVSKRETIRTCQCATHVGGLLIGDCMFVLCRRVLPGVMTRASYNSILGGVTKGLKKTQSVKRVREGRKWREEASTGCVSVQVAQAGGLAGFLHEGAELELLPGQKTHVLQRQRQRVGQTNSAVYVQSGPACSSHHLFTGGGSSRVTLLE